MHSVFVIGPLDGQYGYLGLDSRSIMQLQTIRLPESGRNSK